MYTVLISKIVLMIVLNASKTIAYQAFKIVNEICDILNLHKVETID